MPRYDRSLADFLLYEVHGALSLTDFDFYREHDADTFRFTLDAAEELAKKHLEPAYRPSDREEPQLKDGQVKVHPTLRPYIRDIADSGLITATLPFANDGQQLPKLIYGATHYILTSSHNAYVMFSDLAHGCLELIHRFGNEQVRRIFGSRLSTCQWLGTMCLTEPQAGSSLSDITTTAYPQPDGTYKISGQKIFISAGDHDITENIVHLVLARIEGAPAGTKVISLFVVPKYKVNVESGALDLENGEKISNDVKSIAIFHKMGQKATPAMHLGFGEKNECVGYLLGEENQGLRQMFQMMNGARLGVGMTGIAIASAAYQLSLQYARERVQGRLPVGDRLPVAIIRHPDIQRMLFAQRAVVYGGLSLLFQCYKYLDLLKVADSKEDKVKYDALAELLTPVAKTFGAEKGIESTNLGLQIHGGYGYTADFDLEQLARDVRICSIYEGTTGIHSLAITGREILRNEGAALKFWSEEVHSALDKAQRYEQTRAAANQLKVAIDDFESMTASYIQMAHDGRMLDYIADATLYMEMFGILNIAWQLLKLGTAAAASENTETMAEYIATMHYYYRYELGKCDHLAKVILNPDKLTTSKINSPLSVADH